MESKDLLAEVTAVARPRKPPQWRLRFLLALGVLVVTLFAISRLEPDQARGCGRFIESVYQAFNPPPDTRLSEAGKQFIAEINAQGGSALRCEPTRQFLGLLASDETFVVSFYGPSFDDAALARLATTYGDRIGTLNLMDTGVTDDGLRHLKRVRNLNDLILKSTAPAWANGKRLTPITDAGMAHLELPSLVSLMLDGLPITDAGLKSLPDLPALHTFQLRGTNVEGPGLSRLAGFRNLATVYLCGAALTDEGLGHLAGAPSLVDLQLERIPLTAAGLKRAVNLRQLKYLSIRGCQIPADDVERMKADAPELRIER